MRQAYTGPTSVPERGEQSIGVDNVDKIAKSLKVPIMEHFREQASLQNKSVPVSVLYGFCRFLPTKYFQRKIGQRTTVVSIPKTIPLRPGLFQLSALSVLIRPNLAASFNT